VTNAAAVPGRVSDKLGKVLADALGITAALIIIGAAVTVKVSGDGGDGGDEKPCRPDTGRAPRETGQTGGRGPTFRGGESKNAGDAIAKRAAKAFDLNQKGADALHARITGEGMSEREVWDTAREVAEDNPGKFTHGGLPPCE
jgi:hypothetical protein